MQLASKKIMIRRYSWIKFSVVLGGLTMIIIIVLYSKLLKSQKDYLSQFIWSSQKGHLSNFLYNLPRFQVNGIDHSLCPNNHRRLAFNSLKVKCKNTLCTEYLTEEDWKKFDQCRVKTNSKYNCSLQTTAVDVDNDPLTSGQCRFMNGTGRGVVGLISFPGSGNTWVRGLLQAVTGICTGSLYCDIVLRSNGFDGEKVQSSSVLVVKEHAYTPQWTSFKTNHTTSIKVRLWYDKVILLVRNPFHAFVAEWNRRLGYREKSRSSHTAVFSQEFFGENKEWDKFVKDHILKWQKSFDWFLDCPKGHSVLMVRYEDLQTRLVSETKRMLDFLLLHVKVSKISKQVKTMKRSIFHRNSSREFEHFTNEQRVIINDAINLIISSLYSKFNDSFGIEDYR